MQPTLILINGRGGSGKTTVGRLLIQQLESAAYFDMDFLIVVHPWEYNEELFSLGICNAADLIQNFFEARYQYVVMCAGTEKQHHLEKLLSLISRSPKVNWFYLDVSPDERKRRKTGRARDGADDPSWFEWLENKIGPYAGPPSVEGVETHEIRADGMPLEQLVNELVERIVG